MAKRELEVEDGSDYDEPERKRLYLQGKIVW